MAKGSAATSGPSCISATLARVTDALVRSPVAFERILAKRALLSALGPLAGLRAEGNVTATAMGAPVELPAFTYGIPIIGGKALVSRMFKVLPVGEDAKRRPTGPTITSAGTPVAVRSVCGGPSGNLPAGTSIFWQPVFAGIDPRAVVASGGLTAGAWFGDAPSYPAPPGRCKRVVLFELLGADPGKAFWEAPSEGLPAIIIARTGSTVDERASTVASQLRRHTFRIYVMTANQAGDDERAEEAELLLDAIESTLDGLEDVEGEVFSGPPCECDAETRERPRSPNLHVWSIEAHLYYALRRIDVRLSDGVSWQPWDVTRAQIGEPATGSAPSVIVTDVTTGQHP